ncbi:MAG TPA: YbaY family lipoprotein [Pyrinomonadaceae bacterium]|nr:YbaY family lipoprotein [Pyrinomonadaceae bacterium]
MKLRISGFLLMTLFSVMAVTAQTSWLDRPLRNWNTGDGVVPNAPRTLVAIDARCREQIRTPESLADRAVTRAGWHLFGAAHTYSPVTIVMAMASVDGMCRPNQYNAFVFIGTRFAGTLAPEAVSSRTDGAFGKIQLFKDSASAEFARYTSQDALCCPSQNSYVTYSFTTGARAVVKADDVTTEKTCQDSGGGMETQDNVVSGTVTYRQRSALPQTAVLTVKIVDVSRADASSTTITEQRIETAGKQVPISFDMAYDRSKIQERNRYAVQAEIRDGGKLLFITDTSYPVITQGNPRSVEITVVPVGGGGGGQRQNVIRGTVSYLQRIALTPNSEVTVRLVDSATPDGTPVAETKVSTGNRQVPIAFELPYESQDINRQRNYELRAEIRSDGKLRFKTEVGKAVTLRGNQPDSVELILQAANDEPVAITGKTLSLSKFGTGSMKIGDRPTEFLIRGSVTVNTNGEATVTLSRIDGSVAFTGKLTFFDETTLRITVEGSGDADASGEIEVKYSGRTLRSVAATNLVLDGQNVTLRF